MMKIRSRIQMTLWVVVAILFLLISSVFVFHIVTLQRYRQITDNLILENRLNNLASTLVDDYNLVLLAPSSEERLREYNRAKQEILDTFETLDTAIISEGSKVPYRGLKNQVLTLIKNSDSGIAQMELGNLTAASEVYAQDLIQASFTSENVAGLMVKELEYSDILQMELNRIHYFSLLILILVILMVVAASLVYISYFSKRLTDPLSRLVDISGTISGGNLDREIDKDLLERSDEVGDLSKALNAMISNLKSKIKLAEDTEKDVLQGKSDLEQRNKELEEFNKMVVDRELRMVELKSKIGELEKKEKE
jgi:methyl-accepting chemotaxis protein